MQCFKAVPLLCLLLPSLFNPTFGTAECLEDEKNASCDSTLLEYQLVAETAQEQFAQKTIVLASSPDSSVVRDQNYKMNTQRHYALDLSHLNRVLNVDSTKAMTVRAQAKVNMEQLVQSTLPHGVIPAVVPEFKSITVAGAIVTIVELTAL